METCGRHERCEVTWEPLDDDDTCPVCAEVYELEEDNEALRGVLEKKAVKVNGGRLIINGQVEPVGYLVVLGGGKVVFTGEDKKITQVNLY